MLQGEPDKYQGSVANIAAPCPQGTEGFEAHMDRLMELTEYMVRRIKSMPDKFYLLMEPECVNVSFWYIPSRLRNATKNNDWEQELGKVLFWQNFTLVEFYLGLFLNVRQLYKLLLVQKSFTQISQVFD